MKALILLDLINDIVHEKGKIAASAGEVAKRDVIANANLALEEAKREGWLSILVRVGFDPDYVTQPKDSPFFGKAKAFGALDLSGWGCAFHEGLQGEMADIIVTKHRINAFYATDLEAVLRANKVDTLLIGGVSTTWAVSSTVRDAHDRDYRVTILEDVCAAATEEEHLTSLEPLKRIAEIKSVKDFI